MFGMISATFSFSSSREQIVGSFSSDIVKYFLIKTYKTVCKKPLSTLCLAPKDSNVFASPDSQPESGESHVWRMRVAHCIAD